MLMQMVHLYFFFFVYAHIFRGLFYGSYLAPRDKLWFSGIIILFIMIGTAFMGYVLPWGQMSFWAATVITNLASAIPIVGNDIVVWFWGSFSVDVPTLNRFFALHYLFPFVLVGLVLIHLILLHENKSSDPYGISFFNLDKIPMSPYFLVKDLFGFVLFFLLFAILVFFYPNLLGHPDNYILANPMVTPAHIVPEWYFLPFYAILRSIPDKLQGVILMLLSIFIMIIFPIIINNSNELNFFSKSPMFRLNYRFLTRKFFFLFLFLGWIGGQSVLEPFIFSGRVGMFLYFFYCIFGFYLLVLFDSLEFLRVIQNLNFIKTIHIKRTFI
jgi:quinol-cytochrome oxidoreductase complex cytochrome b subunit